MEARAIDQAREVNVLQAGTRSSRPLTPLVLRIALQSALLSCDTLAVFLCAVLASRAWVSGSLHSALLSPVCWTLSPLYLLVAFNGGAFHSDTLTSAQRGAFRAAKAMVLATTLLVIGAFFLKSGEHLSRLLVFISAATAVVGLVVERVVFVHVVRRLYGRTLRSDVLIVDGVDHQPEGTMRVIDAQRVGLACDLRNPFMLDLLARLVGNADRVVIACAPEKRRSWAMMLKGANIHSEILAGELDLLGPLGVGRLGNATTLTVSAGSLALHQRLLKRALDTALGGLALLLILPLLIVVAIAIKIDSPGPIFFVQQRVGRGNRLFNMYKFRSMRAEACDPNGNRSTSRSDDRITRVGAFIRATSIDELPQLLNILRGEMSIVGPRPHALGSLAGNELFWEVDERYWHRHACKPGLTGLAQVRGLRGATRHRSDLVNRLQADLEYNSGWTVWKDLAILIATVRVTVHRNAY